MLDKLIREMVESGLLGIAPLDLRGKARPVICFLGLMADTRLYTPDREQWDYLVKGMIKDGGTTG